MYSDPIIPIFVSSILVILMIALMLRKLRQPHVVAYLFAGCVLGPSFLGVISDQESLNRIGAFGVIFLLFFVGMEISLRKISENWLISVVGTILQVVCSILLTTLLGLYLEWSLERIILLGFVISLSSTAVVIKLLEDWKEINSRVGQNVIGILLVQDVLVTPMLICLSFLGGKKPTTQELLYQGIGTIIIITIVTWIIIKDKISIPWLRYVKYDHELQVFAALGICFGMAMFTGLMGLSSALGAFVGGMIVGSAQETHWVQQGITSFRTIFIALFFVSIGMIIDINFVWDKIWTISFLVLITLLSNTIINACILRSLGEGWRVSLYGGSLLSQAGEFSFVIASVGLYSEIILYTTYEITIAVIALTLFFSPPWILLTRMITQITTKKLASE